MAGVLEITEVGQEVIQAVVEVEDSPGAEVQVGEDSPEVAANRVDIRGIIAQAEEADTLKEAFQVDTVKGLVVQEVLPAKGDLEDHKAVEAQAELSVEGDRNRITRMAYINGYSCCNMLLSRSSSLPISGINETNPMGLPQWQCIQQRIISTTIDKRNSDSNRISCCNYSL